MFNEAPSRATIARARSFSSKSRGSLDPAGSSKLIEAGAAPDERPMRDLRRVAAEYRIPNTE
jgi:hypothetical protein